MPQVITAKLKLNLTAEQKALVSQTALAYREVLLKSDKSAIAYFLYVRQK